MNFFVDVVLKVDVEDRFHIGLHQMNDFIILYYAFTLLCKVLALYVKQLQGKQVVCGLFEAFEDRVDCLLDLTYEKCTIFSKTKEMSLLEMKSLYFGRMKLILYPFF